MQLNLFLNKRVVAYWACAGVTHITSMGCDSQRTVAGTEQKFNQSITFVYKIPKPRLKLKYVARAGSSAQLFQVYMVYMV